MEEQHNARKIPIVSTALVLANILIFIVLELFVSGDTSAKLYASGVLFWKAVLEERQYYRLLTSMFMHFGSAHLANNMLLLYMIGSRLEDVIGRLRFVIVYFMTGILAGLSSMGYNIWQNNMVVSAGASGAVFGIIGCMAWIVIRHRGRVAGLSAKQMLIFAALSLYGGFANAGTDNVAHIGGLLAGFLVGMLLYRTPNDRTPWYIEGGTD